MKNYWLEKSLESIETEIILVKQGSSAKNWFNKMPSRIPVIFSNIKPSKPEDFIPVIGYALHIRLNNYGVEAVLKASRKYHRFAFYVLYDNTRIGGDFFWVVLHK